MAQLRMGPSGPAEHYCAGMSQDRPMAGKVCLVTGGTGGIGAGAAKALAHLGAEIVVVGRDRVRAERVVGDIRAGTGSSAEYMLADLSSLAQTRRLAREFRERHSRLDVLINNAGAIFEFRRESVEGIEMTLALNHMGPFVLTMELLSLLRASAPARIVVVSSAGHKDAPRFDFDDPEARAKRSWCGAYPVGSRQSLFYALVKPWAHPAFLQYSQSKLANLLFTYELSRRLEGTGVTVNAVHPGLVRTEIASGAGPYSWFMRRVVRLFGIPLERGAETLVHASSAADLEGVSGRYLVKNRPAESFPASRDQAAAEGLWRLSEAMAHRTLELS